MGDCHKWGDESTPTLKKIKIGGFIMMNSVRRLKSEELEVGTADKLGNLLKQFDFVVTEDDFEGISICQILYNGVTKEFVAMNSAGWWVPYKDLHVATEKLNDVIAREFFGLEKCGEYWGRDNTPFVNMPIEDFDAVHESDLILERLARKYDIFTMKERGCRYLTVNGKIYTEKRFRLTVCLAAIDTVRKTME